MDRVAGELSDWQTVASSLGFGFQDVKDIETKHIANKDRRRAFLREWIYRDGSKATYEKLCEVLKNLHENGAAEKIRNIAEKSLMY